MTWSDGIVGTSRRGPPRHRDGGRGGSVGRFRGGDHDLVASEEPWDPWGIEIGEPGLAADGQFPVFHPTAEFPGGLPVRPLLSSLEAQDGEGGGGQFADADPPVARGRGRGEGSRQDEGHRLIRASFAVHEHRRGHGDLLARRIALGDVAEEPHEVVAPTRRLRHPEDRIPAQFDPARPLQDRVWRRLISRTGHGAPAPHQSHHKKGSSDQEHAADHAGG